MIIWGSTGRTSVVGQGSFYCPQCRGHADYVHQCVQRYFTLYFIPLFPTQTLGEYVQCQRCGGNFDASILQLSAEQVEGMFEPWTCSHCQNINPPGEMRCPRCQQARSEAMSSGRKDSPRLESTRQALDELLPKPLPTRAPKKKLQDPEHWQQTHEAGRCRECGVMNPQNTVRCRACGSAITPS